MPELKIKYNGKILTVNAEKDTPFVRFLPDEIKLSHNFVCGGAGTCKKCRIRVTGNPDNFSPLTEDEKNALSESEIKGNIRLACFAVLTGDASIEPVSETGGAMDIQTEGIRRSPRRSSPLKKIDAELSRSDLKTPVPDDENLKAALLSESGVEFAVPFLLQHKITEIKKHIGTGLLTVIANQNRVLDILPHTENKKIYAAAVDIGTTTMALYLCDVQTCEIIDMVAAENPQRAYGADVISRITYINENKEGLENLKNLILVKIFAMISEISKKHGVSDEDIYAVVLTGNTVMMHIAAGLSPSGIAVAPFISSSLFGYTVPAGDILRGTDAKAEAVNGNAEIIFPPAFASYVGGDIATGIIASAVDTANGDRLFLDIGTNGEIGLGGSKGITFCATAAGPAFEGAHIKLGAAGIPGAINRVYFEDGVIKYDTVGGISPVGICGSGIIDALAVMLDVGAVDETGRLCDEDEIFDEYKNLAENFGTVDGQEVFFIDKAENIYLTQKDIREIQLAKASIAAGILTLLHHNGKNFGDIEEMVLAGGFGAHINKASACRIGLIPAKLEDRITVGGNTAGMGAANMLFDSGTEERFAALKNISRYIELSGDEYFMEKYVDMMMF